MSTDDEIEECIRVHYSRLVSVVAAVVGSADVAEDAVQEAFARAWERRSGPAIEHLPGWVVTVALNCARSSHRRTMAASRARERYMAHNGATEFVTGNFEVQMVVGAAIAQLPTRQRQAVVLYYLVGTDVATTASLLGISPGTVKTALSRARARLSELLDPLELEA